MRLNLLPPVFSPRLPRLGTSLCVLLMLRWRSTRRLWLQWHVLLPLYRISNTSVS